MKERFIHFIWQYQYFDKNDLQTSEGEPVQVLQQGMYNSQDAGPDFKGARIRIGGMDWHGDLELHLKPADWDRHRHQQDAAYNSVILHVVWDDGEPIRRQDGTMVPQLSLKKRVAPEMLQQYEGLMESLKPIACTPQFAAVEPLVKLSMIDKALFQRLQRKAQGILLWLEQTGGDWESLAWWLLAQNFGFKKNNEAFLRLAQNMPLKILAKHRDQPLQQEALLFGMAGFIPEGVKGSEDYTARLHKEWQFLSHKYGLEGHQLKPAEWKFLRLRPANFPTIRLAQLAAVVQAQHHLFSLFRDEPAVEPLVKALRKEPHPYWQEHYHFGKAGKNKRQCLGLSSAHNLLINTAAPLLAAYGIYTDEERWVERAMELLQQLPAEDNNIIREWKALELPAENAGDSQALIELFREFCQPKKCLQCSIGLHLLKREKS